MSLHATLTTQLEAAGHGHELVWLSWTEGWGMRVEGEIVACGFSIGTMLYELQGWFEAAYGAGAVQARREDPDPGVR